MNNNIVPMYPVWYCFDNSINYCLKPHYAQTCEYYGIDHDMGSSNPYCLKRHTTYPDNCSEKCSYYRHKYEQLISRTETEPYIWEDDK